METISSPPKTEASAFPTYAPPAPSPPAALETPAIDAWPHWQRIAFRFFFVYLILQVAPWSWFRAIPGVPVLLSYYRRAVDWAVQTANANVFHVRETLVQVNGSGDTSWAWTQMWLYLSLAAIVCVGWSVLDRKRTHYEQPALWLRMIVRYYIASAALSYGIIKLFVLQMPFPSQSLLATPLGDLLPMRFSWLFIGYSVPYEFFSGAMETVAGLLLFYRRTVTLGLFAATGAFLNVVMINMAYDVPVKLYASHLLFACLFLLAFDARRLFGLLVLNRGAQPTTAYTFTFTKGWQRWGGRVMKAYLVWLFLITPSVGGWQRYKAATAPVPSGPFKAGVYDVRQYVVNRDTIPVSSTDTLRWKDVIIDGPTAASVNTLDQVFWQRYRRGYFRYRPDTAARTLAVWKTSAIPRDSTYLFMMRYELPDTTTIRFHTLIRGDSVHVELVRTARHFQLTERQFHWVSEYNR